MLEIKAETSGEYFRIVCEKCGKETKNEYLGWDPGVPHFRTTCEACHETDTWKLSPAQWYGLPDLPDEVTTE